VVKLRSDGCGVAWEWRCRGLGWRNSGNDSLDGCVGWVSMSTIYMHLHNYNRSARTRCLTDRMTNKHSPSILVGQAGREVNGICVDFPKYFMYPCRYIYGARVRPPQLIDSKYK
jgi:hypothetical protein